jgi:hypothetical protein
LRDIGITGTGLVIVWSQLLLWAAAGRTPSDVLLAVGLGMLAPSATAHVRTVLGASGPEAGSSSSPSPPPSPPPSTPLARPEVGTGE